MRRHPGPAVPTCTRAIVGHTLGLDLGRTGVVPRAVHLDRPGCQIPPRRARAILRAAAPVPLPLVMMLSFRPFVVLRAVACCASLCLATALSSGSLHAAQATKGGARESAKGGQSARVDTLKKKGGTDSARADSVRRKRPAGALGRSAADRHLAYRDNGSDLDSLWPPKMPAPLPGSILPARRIVAFYGNPLSRRMGILGEFDPPEMLKKLDAEVAEWKALDPSRPVQPALHLIAVVAQGSAGSDGKWRARMDSVLIEKVYGWAKGHNAILFLDVQVGLSTLEQELPRLERFLKRPEVHLGIDPEFSMKNGGRPGKKIGTFDAADINYASRYLAGLVDKYQLPPKVLVVHRFTQRGVTNVRNITLDPRVQFVMHMDGFGAPWLKRDSYYSYVKKEPVQFAGWKQFTKARNDSPPTGKRELLRLWPVPLYIQYQ